MLFFRIYQYVVPLVLFPLAFWLWYSHYGKDLQLTLFALSIPIVFSYVVPALGTNWLRIWEFNTRWKLGRFRPQHGFLFGTATSLLGLLCLGYPSNPYDGWEFFRSGFIMASVLAFWNWLYDVHAIRVGFLRVYNRAFAKNRGPEAIATEYCPVFFGSFGFCYGISIRAGELYAASGRSDLFWPLLIISHLVVLTVPVLAYMTLSFVASGDMGLRSFESARDASEPPGANYTALSSLPHTPVVATTCRRPPPGRCQRRIGGRIAMKITFVRPNLYEGRSFDAMHPLCFAILRSLTPPDVTTAFYDERLEPIPLDEPTDLVAMTVETYTARRAYQIATAYRRRGVPVVMGGYHPTFLPEEALQFADAVVVGDAEGIWPQVVEDARCGRLQPLYRQDEFPALAGSVPDRSIFRGKRYAPVTLVQYGRGCKYNCNFCSDPGFLWDKARQAAPSPRSSTRSNAAGPAPYS